MLIAKKPRCGAVVGWALIVWLLSVVASAVPLIASLTSGMPMVLAEAFFRRHASVELLAAESTLAVGSILLLYRARIPWKVAGVRPTIQPVAWFPIIVLLVGLNTFASFILFGAKAPDTMISSLSIGQKLLLLCILAPLSEELFVRGWFQTAYLEAVGPARVTSAIVAGAAFFAVMHLGNGTSWPRIIVTVVSAFLSGLIYGHVRHSSGSLLPAVVMHSVFNASGWAIAKPLWLLISKMRM